MEFQGESARLLPELPASSSDWQVPMQLSPILFPKTLDLCRPYVVLKIATSLDGRVACEDKTSQWITQAEARKDAHGMRADSQAILVGEGLGFRKC